MIARVWRGATRARDAAAYTAYLERTGVHECKATPGNRGVTVLQRIVGDRAEFVFISYWNALEDVKAFAGADIAVARFFPEDDAYLIERELTVAHYDVAAGAPVAATPAPRGAR
jgi:heme-degrading monooxygenase HmoA